MCSLNVQHGLLSLGGFQRGKRVGLFSALPVDSSWSCGKWGLRPAREVGTQASPGAGPHPHPRHALPSPSPLSWSSSGEHSCLCLCHSRGSHCFSWGQRSPQEEETGSPCSFTPAPPPGGSGSQPLPCPPTPQQVTYNGAEPMSSSEQSRGSHMQEKRQVSGVPHTRPLTGWP